MEEQITADILDPASSTTSQPVIRLSKHGHRIYTPSRGSEYKRTHGHSKRWRNKVRALTVQGISLQEAEDALRTNTKLRKVAEHKAAVSKHHVALAARSGKVRKKFLSAPSGKEKRR